MGVFTYEQEIASPLPPARVFKGLILEADTLIPKVMPQAIKSSELIEGDGGPGSVKKITFGEGTQYSYVKHKIDAIDKENFAYNYSVIEGDALKDAVEKISYETKTVAGTDGGSIIKNKSTFYTKGDIEMKEEEIKAGKEKALGMFKAIEAYLLANLAA